jgi:hypothetical protein
MQSCGSRHHKFTKTLLWKDFFSYKKYIQGTSFYFCDQNMSPIGCSDDVGTWVGEQSRLGT